jgi:NADH pyrophosphatase NudC (nudix superfamily)
LPPCPGCGKPLRGSDLLVSGHCPHCEKTLTSLLVPTRIGSLVQNEYLALLGALGVLVGLAMATSAESAG